ncbi:MAG: malonyl-[acyl-carrier protein] O-methyltransferase BioC [Gammaproteobacteria bacterium]|nr:malonyl-[acyl-carrier protein] O-methyltransferase BioC [Gammaproteobacteria bacterium]
MVAPSMPLELDKQAVRRSFDSAAATYDQHAVIQREVANRLLERLDWMRLAPTTVLDLGAGTGFCARALERRYAQARILLVDLAPAMLLEARRQRRWRSAQRYVCADASALPFGDASVDVVVSSLTFQWCEDLEAAFRECRRVLRPGGLLLFSSLGPATLHELRAAYSTIDERPHVNRFKDMHEVGDTLIRAGFASPVLEREDLVATYAEVTDLMRDLKGIGARNSLNARPRTLGGRRALTQLRAAYEPYRRDGVLPATYELVFGHGWAVANARAQDGSTVFPLNRLTRR